MILILEIAMLLGGLYALFAGKIPDFLFGGKDYVVVGTPARLIGLLLMAPLPLALLAGVVLGLTMGEDGIGYSVFCELGIVVAVVIAAIVAVRQVRQPRQPADPTIPSGPSA